MRDIVENNEERLKLINTGVKAFIKYEDKGSRYLLQTCTTIHTIVEVSMVQVLFCEARFKATTMFCEEDLKPKAQVLLNYHNFLQ